MLTTQVLLEREGDLELLSSLLVEAGSSGGCVVLVRGEAGVGKTSLVRAFLTAHAGTAHVLYGSCDDLSTPQPLGPFWDMARVEPALMEPLDMGDPSRVLAKILDLLARALRPTILVIEDTQWADEATLDAVKYLGRRIEQTHGLLILTYRDGEVDYDHPLRIAIGEMPPRSMVRINLSGLSAQAVAEMARSADVDLGDLMAMTGGNPLLVSELLNWDSEGVPLSVQDSVLARVAKLSPQARETIELVSVIPGEAERRIIDAIAGWSEGLLREGQRQGLILVGDTAVGFRHELTRRVVESALDSDRRRHLNRRVLQSLAKTPELADPARLTHHAHEAGDVDAVIAYAPDAARRATAAGANQEAVDQYRRLRQYVDLLEPDTRARLFEDWAEAESITGNYIEAIRLNEAARSLYEESGDRSRHARVLAQAARNHEYLGERRMAEDCARRAVEVLGPNPDGSDLAWALEVNAWLAMMANRETETLALVDQALEVAGSRIDERLYVRCLILKGTVHLFSHYPDGVETMEDARRRAGAAGLWLEEMRALYNHAGSAAEWRDLATAEDYTQRALALSGTHEDACWASAATSHAWVLELKGEWHIAEDLARDAAERSAGIFLSPALLVVGRLEARQGRIAARQTLSRAWELAVLSGDHQVLSPAAAALAEYSWITGDEDVPIDEIKRALDLALDLRQPWSAGEIAFWLWKLGELTDAPSGLAEPYRLLMTGQAGAAAKTWQTLGCPYDQAIALAQGDTKSQLEAVEILQTLDATAVAAKVRKQLRDQGVSTPRGRGRETRRHPVGLTPRQNEVLLLLGEGLTNVDIADRLFLSPRTVEHHVSAVMSKLNVTSRDQAVSWATEQGLLMPA